MNRSWIPVLTALSLAACGGSELTDDEAQAREDAQRAAIAIQSHGPNPISIWNEVAFKTAGNISGHDLVTVHLAMYDAVMAIAGTHRPYATRPATSGAGGSAVAMEAAAIEAAYRVIKGLFPAGGANYETAYTQSIGALLDGAEKTRGLAIGAEVAAGMLALRANDGRATVLPPYVPGTLPGQFRGTNPVNRVGPYVKPFATLSHAQFRAPGPLALGSDDYAVDFNEVKAMGSAATSTPRSPAQTEVARFHTESPNTFWARNLRQFATANASLADNARLTAMIWTAWSDALGGCFESKYHYNFWRPTSAITLADTDGNAATLAETWAPVVPTPNHPEYPAAHGCGSGAVAEAVRSFYGMKKVSFEFTSSVAGTVNHRYERTDDLVKEITDARVWGGMHFRTSGEHGAELGKQVAKWVAKNHFQPAN